MKPRRRMRPIITSAIVFLLVGAITNVIVTWLLCAISYTYLDVQSVSEIDGDEITSVWNRYRLADDSDRLIALQGQVLVRWPFMKSIEVTPAEWRDVERIGETTEIHAGWPCHSLRGQAITDTRAQELRGFLNLRTLHIGSWEIQLSSWIRWLPYHPSWPAFAINSLFYGTIFYFIFGLLHTLPRCRRARRNLCSACAYPIGTSAICTECGKPVKPRE